MIEKQKTAERDTLDRNSSSAVGFASGQTTSLPADVLEKLYRSYSLKQKRSGLTCFIVASVVFDLWAILVPQGQSKESLGESKYSIRVTCDHHEGAIFCFFGDEKAFTILLSSANNDNQLYENKFYTCYGMATK